MTPLVWLAGAVVSGVGAWLVGWPAWQAYRSRERRDDNIDRYLAWRGRADRTAPRSLGEGPTGEERRRLWIAAGLVLVALLCLAAFLAAS